MPLPQIALTKIAVYLMLIALGAGLTLFVFFQQQPVSSPAKPVPEVTSGRRGDDPTYAEELKKMSALLQDVNYRFKDSESQRLLAQEHAANLVQKEAQRAMQQSQKDAEQLQRALQEARAALNEKIQATDLTPVTQQLRAEIERLTREQEALRAQWATRPPVTPAPAETRPEANRILTPHPKDRPGVAGAGPAGGDPPGAPPNDLAPGAPQVDLRMLDRLRQMPGMEGVVDRLTDSARHPPDASRLASGAPRIGSVRGLQEEYMTLTPYVAGERPGRSQTRAPAPNPQAATPVRSLQPRRYPFTVKTHRDGASATIPVYTIPDTATLVHNSTLTPLVGRVPFRGHVRDPFRFKLITGATNLATNGHRIPGIVNAVWTGYAVGIREQSCVRAYLDTVTFTFEDGRLHTVNKGKGGSEVAASVNNNLGYLTDSWGKPCIRGQFFNNAGEYLKDRSLAAFLDGLANAYARSKVTVGRDAYGLNSYVSGDTYEYALGRGLGGASSEIADYVKERAEDAFDVVYAPPGIDVQIFIETQIPIDYQTDGRKLHYSYAAEASHAVLD